VIAAIAPRPGDRFIEIGPGPGVLTSRLASRAGHVTAIEIDRDLASALKENAGPNVEIVVGDVLKIDLAPLIGAGPVRIAGNLPYNISSPILFKLLAQHQKRGQPQFPANKGDGLVVDATVMLQREVVDRIVAKPGTKDYGVLSIFAQAQADLVRLLTLPPGAFRPAPKVHSAVVRLTFKRSAIPAELGSVLEPMVRTMFMQRRKTLLNALRPFAEPRGCETAAALAAAGIDPRRRPETLSLAELIALAQTLSLKP